jgi:hypothetical protein
MPDILIDTLSRDQIHQLDKLLEVFGEPVLAEDVPPIVVVLQAAQQWYLKKQGKMRLEERGG